jgi:hypothetical protein
MQTREYSVYNETRENFLSTRVTVIDTKSEPLKAVKALIEGLAPNTETGLWLNPLKNVPTVPRLSSYDLVYLDQECRVVQGVALIADDDVPPFEGHAASALVLPIHTFSTSHTHPGDQVVLYAAQDEVAAGSAPSPAFAAHAHPQLPSSTALQLSPPLLPPIVAPVLVPEIDPVLDIASLALEPVSNPQLALHVQQQNAALREPGFLAFLRVLPRLRLRISISVTTVPAARPAAPLAALATPALPAPSLPGPSIDPVADAPRQRASLPAWLASRVSSAQKGVAICKQKLVAGKQRYLRMAEIFVYGSERVTPRHSARRFPHLEEEC